MLWFKVLLEEVVCPDKTVRNMQINTCLRSAPTK